MHASRPAIRRLCLAVDVESYSRRPRDEQIDVQNRLLWTMVQACRTAGISPARCDRQDSGDGQILILPAGVDEGAVLPNAVRGLLTALHRVNHPVGLGGRIRLRVSVGQGAIQIGAVGFVAPAVVTVCRLLDSDELRDALVKNPGHDAAFIVMADLYHDMFAQGYGGLPANRFRRVFISKPGKKFAAEAWMQVPDRLPAVVSIPAYSETAELRKRQRGGGVGVLEMGAAAAVAWTVFTGIQHGHDDSGHWGSHHDSGQPSAQHSTGDHDAGNHGLEDHDPGGHSVADHDLAFGGLGGLEGHDLGEHFAADHGDHMPDPWHGPGGPSDSGPDYSEAASDPSGYDDYATVDDYTTDHGGTGDPGADSAPDGTY